MATNRRSIRRVARAGLVVGAVGLATAARGAALGETVLVVGACAAVGSAVWWLAARQSTAQAIARWTRRSHRTGGTATLLDHLRRTSRWAMLRRARHLRPSLRERSRWQLLRTPVAEYAALLGRSGWRTLYVSPEDIVLRVAGTRSGKTTAMAARIIDAPGGCVVTSTRVDLLRTLPLRARRGTCHVYDPAGISGMGSTLKWTPLAGCRRAAIAQQRGIDMIPTSGSTEGERWDGQARRVLGVLMHAAALIDQPMRIVVRWLAADGADLQRAMQEVHTALACSEMADAMRAAARQFFTTVDRTRQSIVTTAMPALAWLTDPVAAAIGDCAASESLDLGGLLDGAATLYVLGRKDGATGPLTGALVAEIVRLAEVTAERRGGRLDPHLTLVLDEAAKVAPGPLHLWSADCGGRGIVLDVAVQSLAALRETWGPYAAAMILSNANAVLVGAGCKDPDDLGHWEALTGLRQVPVETRDSADKLASRTTQSVPVIPRAQIAALAKGRGIVYGLGPVTIVRTPNTWRQRRVRRALQAAGAPFPTTRWTERDDALVDELLDAGQR